jgi:mono/diheme cytochrome c family protein
MPNKAENRLLTNLLSRDREGAVLDLVFRHPTRMPITIAGLFLSLVCLVAGGCRQDMQDQPKYKTYGESKFFEDGRDSRPIPPGTVARGELNDDTAFYQGKVNGADIDYFPIPINQAVIERGHDRFDIYCSPCHGRLGNGLGMIVRRGLKQPPSYHIERLRTAPVGHFFDVVTNGYGAMLNYAAQIQPRDRWAIISYIRALQFSQNASVADLPTEIKAKLPAGGNLNPVSPAASKPAATARAGQAKAGTE